MKNHTSHKALKTFMDWVLKPWLASGVGRGIFDFVKQSCAAKSLCLLSDGRFYYENRNHF
jgi:hypothetical protein